MSISFSSSKLFSWFAELVKDVKTKSAYDNSNEELLTWSFKFKLKLGPPILVVSVNIIGVSSKVTL